MRNFLILTLLVAGLTSCSKDSLDLSVSEFTSIDKSEIFVTITYLAWSEQQCEPGCIASSSQVVTGISNAKVEIYAGVKTDSDHLATPIHFARTDDKGTTLFRDLDPGQYTIYVDTSLGQKSRTIYTQLNRRSSIDFSF